MTKRTANKQIRALRDELCKQCQFMTGGCDVNIPQIIERSNPRAFMHEIDMQLSKRDANDLSRLRAKLSMAGLVRYVAAHYMDPWFCSGSEARIFRTFGNTIETAYQTMLAELECLRKEQSSPSRSG